MRDAVWKTDFIFESHLLKYSACWSYELLRYDERFGFYLVLLNKKKNKKDTIKELNYFLISVRYFLARGTYSLAG
jgi:hypothetical protein